MKNKIVTPTKEAKNLIAVYRIFYKENPNFSDPYTQFKIKFMLEMLKEFGLTYKIEEAELNRLMISMIPVGQYNKTIENVKLDLNLIRTINTIGNVISKHLSSFSEEKEKVAELAIMCSVGNKKQDNKTNQENVKTLQLVSEIKGMI